MAKIMEEMSKNAALVPEDQKKARLELYYANFTRDYGANATAV